jgi:glycosyltransferase involved in cell wall biosynthesis
LTGAFAGLRNGHVLLLASSVWSQHQRGALNCHHIARRLGERNRVIYIEPQPMRAPSLFHRDDLWKIADRLRRVCHFHQQKVDSSAGVAVHSPAAVPLPRCAWAQALNDRLLQRTLKRALRDLDPQRVVVWSFLPVASSAFGLIPSHRWVYHCVDDYAGNPGVNADLLKRREAALASKVSLCIATSRPLARQLQAVGGRVHLAPNVGEVERFAAAPSRLPAEMDRLPRPRVGYLGNISRYKIDLELLVDVARSRPDWSFVLVGPTGAGDPATSVAELRRLSNIHLLGPCSAAAAPGYVHALDVALIPFRRSPVTDCSLPLKTFEYLAAGKPVVATPIAALREEPLDDVILYAESPETFTRAIETALGTDDDAHVQRRRRLAATYDWNQRMPELEEAVRQAVVSSLP